MQNMLFGSAIILGGATAFFLSLNLAIRYALFSLQLHKQRLQKSKAFRGKKRELFRSLFRLAFVSALGFSHQRSFVAFDKWSARRTAAACLAVMTPHSKHFISPVSRK